MLDVSTPNTRGQAVFGGVGHCDCLIIVVDPDESDHRAERFFGEHWHVVRDIGEHSRGIEVSVTVQPSSPSQDGGALCHRLFDLSLHLVDRDRGFAIIPFGSLDDDVGVQPQRHIFVGSKAPWFEITDDLPQFEAGAPM